ncbi:hypothetical protein HBI56_084800 [Parastagonospora nodorum]|uniref:Uncharacterized protein n=1 Tax=Phaeosphaeria nodorum (strain SN15 / ATCC MYA-4574 / FGSC 10173) TaxID=321614 RepID=A0A7U2FJW5_PHANO|nr:hypothetical protein HBH56_101760 [Parastagonospora nodorum]QRD04466.1 hypothetical protein JI435_104290 [Parastagonospora nodorum SN15]KAH3929292.1 hypothetical protein HBH54_128670 [Parastagonospora nodorum]KAH3951351.1 hypothetical protein HBH53_062660 [Parastagonospora nodorum]KAH3975256.1 hypothetical protein HBH52_124190 [Parastagonospora nodorum]
MSHQTPCKGYCRLIFAVIGRVGLNFTGGSRIDLEWSSDARGPDCRFDVESCPVDDQLDALAFRAYREIRWASNDVDTLLYVRDRLEGRGGVRPVAARVIVRLAHPC